MTVYRLEPLDSQFYRGTLPFDAGVDGFATTEPMPWPSTVYGAFRTAGLVRAKQIEGGKIANFDPIWGDATRRGSFCIKGPFLWRDRYQTQEMLLPMPADLVATDEDEPRLRHGIPKESQELAACSDLQPAPDGLKRLQIYDHAGEKVETLEERFLSSQCLQQYLTQGLQNVILNEDNFPQRLRLFQPEPRIGIKRAYASHQAEDGMLHAAWHHRFMAPSHSQKQLSYWVHVDPGNGSSMNLPATGVLKLGGEGRVARYQEITGSGDLDSGTWASSHRDEVIEIIAKCGQFKLYLLTPGLFGGKVHPFVEANNKITLLIDGNMQATLVGLATYKPVLIGGWDMQKKFPKPLITSMPAGTVYFFQIINWPTLLEKEQMAQMVFDRLNFESISTDDIRKEGFGLVLVGGWHV